MVMNARFEWGGLPSPGQAPRDEVGPPRPSRNVTTARAPDNDVLKYSVNGQAETTPTVRREAIVVSVCCKYCTSTW